MKSVSDPGHGCGGPRPKTDEPAPPEAAPRRRIASTELFAGAREVLIDHAGETYTLRHTSLGKLILTK